MDNITINELRAALRSIPTYDESTSAHTFKAFMRTFDLWSDLNGVVSHAQKKIAMLYALRADLWTDAPIS